MVKVKRRPTQAQPDGPVQIRLSPAQLERLEVVRQRLVDAAHPATMGRGARGFTRSDCVRLALELGLAALERGA